MGLLGYEWPWARERQRKRGGRGLGDFCLSVGWAGQILKQESCRALFFFSIHLAEPHPFYLLISRPPLSSFILLYPLKNVLHLPMIVIIHIDIANSGPLSSSPFVVVTTHNLLDNQLVHRAVSPFLLLFFLFFLRVLVRNPQEGKRGRERKKERERKTRMRVVVSGVRLVGYE